jgi:hypothetical protein
MKRLSKEKAELQEISDTTSDALLDTQQELKMSQEHCGQLYAETRNLQTDVRYF